MKIQQNIPLKDYSNFKIGGFARYFAIVQEISEFRNTLKEWSQISKDFAGREKEVFVFGGGTNVLFPDEGFPGLVIKIDIQGIEKKEELVRVGAGTEMKSLLEFCIENSLSGLEWAGGLPGSVGGALRGNAGAYMGETKDNVELVESLSLESFKIKKRDKEKCDFEYRNSVFKSRLEGKEAIIYITFRLQKGDKDKIRVQIEDKIEKRKLRHPLEYPNLGSIFKNVPTEKFTDAQMENLSQYIKNDPFPVIPTAKLNYLAGLSGEQVGDAQLSTKHTNFIVNLGNATAEDVKTLIKIIKNKINENFGVELEEEIMYLN